MGDRLAHLRIEPVTRFDGADVDRPRPQHELAHRPVGQLFGDPAAYLAVGLEFLGWGHVGHLRELVGGAFLRHLERCGEVQNRLAGLAGDDSAI